MSRVFKQVQTHNGKIQFKIVPFCEEVWEMIIGFHCGWEIRETPAGNVVLNVIDSFDELKEKSGAGSKNHAKGKKA